MNDTANASDTLFGIVMVIKSEMAAIERHSGKINNVAASNISSAHAK
ncbi:MULTISPECIES: hypothetical protein [unclassified Rhizobium]|nr:MULTISPECIES: hypothetical protein [unclassified Rhizobium]